MSMSIADLDLSTLAGHIVAGDVSARDATAACLDALETVGRQLNCTVATYPEEATAAAVKADQDRRRGFVNGPLHGVPMAHKDLFDVVGRVVAAGSKIMGEHRAVGTASAMAKLERAGAINLGALHMSEFAMSPTGFNAHLGRCLNPWSADHVCGGSSSGSATAVGARLIPASLGSDTGGSARVPAAACGITALKPTYGLIGKDGVVPLASSLDCISPMGRSAADCALLLDVLAGPEPRDPATAGAPRLSYSTGLQRRPDLAIGVLPEALLAGVDPEIRRVLDTALEVFKALGAKVVEAEVDPFEPINVLNRTLLVVEAATYHRRNLVDRPRDYSNHVRRRLQTGLFVPATRYLEALTLRGTIARSFVDKAFRQATLLLMPCIPAPVPPISADQDGEAGTGATAIMDFTRSMNYLGLPAASVPAGFTADGLPVGFQLVGRHFDERRILAAANAFQGRTDWHRRRPPVHAAA
jgi:aspartyl-tRNA(Asn)/glutamyl-tRNA(Gln) amidotransferase subunit A